jgi:hypothetical protein
MKTRYFALFLGLVFLAVGILGFVPTLRPAEPDMPPLIQSQHYGFLFGLFPVNWLHNGLHLVFGLWGVLAYGSFGAARAYAMVVAVAYAVAAAFGFFPGLRVLFGYMPLYGNDIWLHAAIAVFGAIFAALPATDHSRSGVEMRR